LLATNFKKENTEKKEQQRRRPQEFFMLFLYPNNLSAMPFSSENLSYLVFLHARARIENAKTNINNF
jgi:hypothetical protein